MKINSLPKCCAIFLFIPLLFQISQLNQIATAYTRSRKSEKPAYHLSNKYIRARFNENGLVSLYDYSLHQQYDFDKDDFSIVIDGKKFQNGELERQGIIRHAHQLVYRFESKNYQIDVVYQLEDSWDFISKQLKISPKQPGNFKVNNLSVIEENIKELVNDEHIIKSQYKNNGTKNYGVFLRFKDNTGMLALVQNPFLEYHRDGNTFSLTYDPDMNWKSSWGAFTSDRACIGVYKLQGFKIPTQMIPEWNWTGGINPNSMQFEYQSEVDAFTHYVNSFVIDHMPRPLNVQVGWTENDYQIDVSTASGQEVYKRIIDRASDLGLKYIVYQPTNSLLGNYLQASDNWHVEDRLWLGMGIQIRKNEWNPMTDTLPSTVQTMLNYVKSKDMKLLAYVYPILPFQQNNNWLVPRKGNPSKKYASLGNYEFQDWLIKELSGFMDRTGIGGYSFDYTFLNQPGYSVYSQWRGWRRIMETMRKKYPDIVMDGRQAYQNYGPWSWLAGSYPHPTSTDEQPESFIPFPDLHFDRVSADRERYTAYRYRIREYCPQILMPGYIGHQTDRFNTKGEHIREPFHVRDWDYLGWKYSLISSIGYAGLNNVMNMIPAHDPEEYRHFPKQDVYFFNDWINWTKTNKDYLEQTKPILGQPALGKVDGTSAIINDKGFIFLFNPNGRALPASFSLDASIGLKAKGQYVLKEIYPEKEKYIGKPSIGFWTYGDRVHIPLDGTRAKVLKIIPASEVDNQVLLFNVGGKVQVRDHRITLADIKGEVGAKENVVVALPKRTPIKAVDVNGRQFLFEQKGQSINFNLSFAGQPFHHMQEVGSYDSTFSGGIYRASFSLPEWIFKQLKERKELYPVPWTPANYDTPWLVPERLPLFVQIAQPSDTMNVSMKMNGKPVKLIKAYSSVRPVPKDFVGYYIDCSDLKPGKQYNIELALPRLKPGQFQGLFFDNIVTNYTDDLKKN